MFDLRDVPPATRWTIPGTEIRLIRIPEAPASRNWVFSAETLTRLPEFQAALGDAPLLAPVTITDWTEFRRNFTDPVLAALPVGRLPAPLLQWNLLGFACLRFALRRSKGKVAAQHHMAMLLVAGVFLLLLDAAYTFITWRIALFGGISDIGLLFTDFAIYLAAACWLVAEAIIATPNFPARIL